MNMNIRNKKMRKDCTFRLLEITTIGGIKDLMKTTS